MSAFIFARSFKPIHVQVLFLASLWSAVLIGAGPMDRGGRERGAVPGTWVRRNEGATEDSSHPLLKWVLGRPLDFSRAATATPAEFAPVFLGSKGPPTAIAQEESERVGAEVMARLKELHPELTLPTPLASNLLLWSRVYSEWSSRQFVVFDEKHPDRIYGVLDFRELENRSRNAVAFEILLEREMNRRRAAYRDAFDGLERQIRRKFGARANRVSLAEALAAIDPSKLGDEARAVRSALEGFRCDDPRGHSLREFRQNLRFQRGQRDQVLIALLRFENYRPWVEDIFRREGVPVALSRLALVESSFNWKAESRVGAVGVWQFMPQSASAFLNQMPSRGIDERRSVIKSAVAAARLLRQNHQVLGNWSLAVVAYNSGMRAPLRIPRAQRISGDFDHLISSCSRQGAGRRPVLGFASRNYLAEFLAMTLVEDEHEQVFGSETFRRWKGSTGSIHGRYVFERVGPGSAALSFRGLIARRGGPSPRWSALNPEISNPAGPLPRALWIARPLDDMTEELSAQRVTTLMTPGEVATKVDQRRSPPSDST